MSDLISRQAAIDALLGITAIRNTIPLDSAIFNIKKLPSAEPPYVAEIESEYKKWVNMTHINKPLAKALYEVWKKHDREDVSRNERSN